MATRGQELADDLARRGDQPLVVCGDRPEPLVAAELVGDLTPGRAAQRRAVVPAPTGQRVELRADEHGHLRLRHGDDARLCQDRLHPLEPLGTGPLAGQVVEERERVGLAAAELGGHVEHGRGARGLARQPTHDLGGRATQGTRQEGPLEEPVRLLVVRVCPAVAHLVQVHGKLRGVQRPALAQVLARGHDLVPGLEFHGFTSSFIRRPSPGPARSPRQDLVSPGLRTHVTHYRAWPTQRQRPVAERAVVQALAMLAA